VPFYVYECPAGHKTEKMRNIARRHERALCDHCTRFAYQVLTPVPGIVKNPAVPRRK
jgi:hypothetical protein